MKKGIIIALAVFSLGFTACSQSAEENMTEAGITQTVKRVNKSEFKQYLSEHPDVQLIDVRTPGEYAGGTIEHAKNIDYNGADFKTEINKLDKSAPVLIFCMSGGRSGRALQLMDELGFEYVLELAGGYRSY
ncbi:rhodanese-like domain-containing protein [Crocinitomix catalasitica]|uniref:rhodanese-like domain-containing protein n=1 Tax=Crocinitomix catalasitica TaxID=184607 RepID=UPI000688118C|nr:rhodanese-like domain-containing protein [Crocinitomix catalasitica]